MVRMRQVDPKALSDPASEVPAAAPLRMCLLGKVAVYAGEREIEIANRKCRALLGYLALAEGGQDTRERLVGLRWSESEEERARASLRQAIHEIKLASAAVGWSGFRADKQTLAIGDVALTTDIDDIFAAT